MKKTFLQELKTLKWQNFLGLTVAGIVNAIGVTVFLAPVNLYDSGLSGTSLLLNAIFSNPWLPLSFFLIVLNLPFFIIGFKKQGAAFTVYSLYAIAMYSLVSFLIQHVLPIADILTKSPIAGDDMLLCALFGGLVSGAGSGLTIRFGGAIDGVEVMAVIFAKFIGITVGTFVMIYNVIIYVAAGIVFASWTIPLYSVIAYALGIKSVDFVVEGLDKAKAAMIITAHPDLIAQDLSEQLGRGITMINAQGYYSKENKTMLYCVVNRFQIGKLKRMLSSLDPTAFVTITDISDTLGASLKFSLKSKKQKPTLMTSVTDSTSPIEKASQNEAPVNETTSFTDSEKSEINENDNTLTP